MTFLQRLSSAWARRRSGTPDRGAPEQATAQAAGLDPAEELQKVQRGLRRLGLASDRSAGMLEVMAGRLDEIQQALREMRRPSDALVALDEADLLRMLDQLDLALGAPELSTSARVAVERTSEDLLAAARWEAVAARGASPTGTDIRIAERTSPDAAGTGIAEGASAEAAGTGIAEHALRQAYIERVLQQGYRRADGSLLRPAIVVAAVRGEADAGHADSVVERVSSRHDST